VTTLAPNLFTRRFSDFMEIGRARLHALAPLWTDYNAHDPGITLMELLAWTSEAQLYSLSRMRRDERAAYAALLGVQPGGTQPATGLIWPDPLDPASPVATYMASFVLPKYTSVALADTPGPAYRTLQDLLWMPGAIQSLITRQGNTRIDHTTKNKRGKLVFYPFGQDPAVGKTLSLSFRCRDDRGLFGARDRNALWPIGVLASPSPAEVYTSTGADTASHPGSRLSAALVAGGERFPVRIAADSSQSMLTTGVILLDLSNVLTSPVDFTIEFTAPQDLIRPPRVLRIETNVLPVEQSESVDQEPDAATGLPGWSFTLDKPGLRFAPGGAPVVIQTFQPVPVEWRQCAHLSELTATDNAFEFDADSGTVTFGNGINGRIPKANEKVLATYQISAGSDGNIARNRRWIAKSIQGTYGTNLNPLSGGANATGLLDLERSSRQRVHEEHPLITSQDIVEAAYALPLLEVGRAWAVDPSAKTPSTGIVTLVAMRQRPGGVEPTLPPETPLWLRSIQQLLRPRMTLGSRLRVMAPQYVSFTINAVLEVVRSVDPVQVKDAVTKVLRDRFQLVPFSPTAQVVEPGVPVSRRDIAGWIRGVEGINRVVALSLATSAGPVDGALTVPVNGLAKLDVENSPITVARPGASGGAA
jgi:predicted phage baseplate assembly protein